MKIVMLLSSFYPLMGGAEIQAKRLSENLVNKGHKVSVITRWHDGLKRRETINGIDVIRVKVSRSDKLAPIVYIIKAMSYIFINKKNIDIVHAHSLKATGLTAAIATFLFNIPSIAKIAGGGNKLGCEAKRMYMERGIKKIIIKFIQKNISKFIAISDAIFSDLIDINTTNDKIEFIPNGIEMPNLNTLKPKIEVENIVDKRVFIYAGRFEIVKGIDILLKAWINTSNEFKKNNQLLVLGEGKFNINDYINCNSITFVGRVNNVSDFLKNADYFILPSRYEGISNALLEAISHKVLTIVTEVGGNIDIVKDNFSGIVIKSEDVGELTNIFESIDKYDQNKDLLIDNAYKFVLEKYNMEKISGDYERMYFKLKQQR